MKISKNYFPLSPFHLAGIGAVQLAVIILFFEFRFAVIPILFFLAVCGVAPFLPGSGFFLPVTSRGSRKKKAIALTFDDGPDPSVTPEVMKLLSKYSIQATFFVTGKNASRNPEIIHEILNQGHTIGNHSYDHDPVLMFRSKNELYQDIVKTQQVLSGFSINAYAFRPPAGITNPRLRKVLLELGMHCINFSCRAFDAGNRRITSLAVKILRKVKSGDIILLHDISPLNKNDINKLLNEFEELISGLKEKKIDIIPLADLTGKEIMGKIPVKHVSTVQSYYNQYAFSYDEIQANSGVRKARNIEFQIVSSKLPDIIKQSDNVLELGSGTGMYTIPIAKICSKLTAVDISCNMLKIAKNKIKSEKLTNVHLISADIENCSFKEKYDVICSFSSFEYVKDIKGMIKLLSGYIKPGGLLYFTTANRSLLRFFTQIGNAIIQGVWLRSYSKNDILKTLDTAGIEVLKTSTFLCKSFITKGMIIEILAVKK
ncbi:MAG: polysaccharide deacetylase family protein [Spirochaetes bacterium]|nr:polysaccharide deacetylase family protein [Spirochaetota bacterium]